MPGCIVDLLALFLGCEALARPGKLELGWRGGRSPSHPHGAVRRYSEVGARHFAERLREELARLVPA